jgi:hypothetical protein
MSSRLTALAGLIAACERLSAATGIDRSLDGLLAVDDALLALRASPPLAEDGELVEGPAREAWDRYCDMRRGNHEVDQLSFDDVETLARAVLAALDARLEVKP